MGTEAVAAGFVANAPEAKSRQLKMVVFGFGRGGGTYLTWTMVPEMCLT